MKNSLMVNLSGKKFWVWVIVIVIIASFIRFYKLTSVPSSLYYDEVDLGYQARSLIETHKDYRGRQSPFYELTFNDPKTPLPIILSIPATLIFKNEELQVRTTPAVVGIISVLLAILIAFVITKNRLASLIVGLVFAVNPWNIQFSRWAVESIFSLTFYLLSLYLFLKSLQKKEYLFLILSTISFSLTVYTYRTMSFFIPLTLLTLLIVYRKELLEFGLKKLAICTAIAVFLIGPFLYFTTIGAPDIPRISQISIFSDPLVPIFVQRDREMDSSDFANPVIGKSASKLSYFFHNKLLSYSRSFFSNYLQTFSTDFLFLNGAANNRETVGEMGELFYIDILSFIVGFWFLVKNYKNKNYFLILILLVLSPIPSAFTIDGAKHGSRLFIFSIPLLLMIGIGWWQLIVHINKLPSKKILLTILFGFWGLCFIFYYHRYLVEYPIESASYFGYGFKQAMLEVGKLSPKYKYVYLSPANDPPMIYYLFWNHIPPRELQQYGSAFNVGQNKGKPLDKFKVVGLHIDNLQDLNNLGKTLKPNILYVFAGGDFPEEIHNTQNAPTGVKIIDIVKYPDNESAFYLVEKAKGFSQS